MGTCIDTHVLYDVLYQGLHTLSFTLLLLEPLDHGVHYYSPETSPVQGLSVVTSQLPKRQQRNRVVLGTSQPSTPPSTFVHIPGVLGPNIYPPAGTTMGCHAYHARGTHATTRILAAFVPLCYHSSGPLPPVVTQTTSRIPLRPGGGEVLTLFHGCIHIAHACGRHKPPNRAWACTVH